MIEMLQQSIPDLIAVVNLAKDLCDMVQYDPLATIGALVAGVQLALYIVRKLRNHKRFW